MSATTPSAWLLRERLAAREHDARRATSGDAMRESASRRRRVLPMPGAPVTRDDDGRLVVDAALERGHDLRELGLAPDERRAADDLASSAHVRVADDARSRRSRIWNS